MKTNFNRLIKSGDKLSICWLGNDSWLLCCDEHLIGFDLDITSDMRLKDSPISIEELAGSLDYLFISHGHGDHFHGDTCKGLLDGDCIFVVPQSCMVEVDEIGIPEDRIHWVAPHQSFSLSPWLHVNTTHALHGHIKHSVYEFANALDCGYRLDFCGRSIFEPGDSVLLQQHLEMEPVDLLFISPTEHNTHIEGSISLIEAIKPHRIFAQHFGTYKTDSDNEFWTRGYPSELKSKLPKKVQSRFSIPKQGRVYHIEDKPDPSDMMKAVIWSKYGPPDLLKIDDVKKPVPKSGEVLIKIHSATVTAGDSEMRELRFSWFLKILIRLYFGVFGPRDKIMGQEIAGEIVAVGEDVTLFNIGDSVVATTGMSLGGYAQYICLPQKSSDSVIAIKPEALTYNDAAALPVGGLEALHFIRKANIRSGQKVLIIGGGGSIGSAAIQLIKNKGGEVTCVDSESKLDFMLEVGGDHVIDYRKEDFALKQDKYDVIFDIVVGGKFLHNSKALVQDGAYLMVNPKPFLAFTRIWSGLTSNRKVVAGVSIQKNEDLKYLLKLYGEGKFKTYIDKCYKLEDIVKAHEYVDSGEKKGNVVITVVDD